MPSTEEGVGPGTYNPNYMYHLACQKNLSSGFVQNKLRLFEKRKGEIGNKFRSDRSKEFALNLFGIE
jgi:hypothetical protein